MDFRVIFHIAAPKKITGTQEGSLRVQSAEIGDVSWHHSSAGQSAGQAGSSVRMHDMYRHACRRCRGTPQRDDKATFGTAFANQWLAGSRCP